MRWTYIWWLSTLPENKKAELYIYFLLSIQNFATPFIR